MENQNIGMQPSHAPLMSRRLFQIARFRALSAAQQRTLLAAWAWLPLFWLSLRLLGLSRFRDWLQRTAASPAGGMLTIPDIQALGESVNIAARHAPFPATCLTRSLLLNWMLQRRGVRSDLRIGVRLTHGKLYAHAWVECGGVPVNDRADIATEFPPFAEVLPTTAFDRA